MHYVTFPMISALREAAAGPLGSFGHLRQTNTCTEWPMAYICTSVRALISDCAAQADNVTMSIYIYLPDWADIHIHIHTIYETNKHSQRIRSTSSNEATCAFE